MSEQQVQYDTVADAFDDGVFPLRAPTQFNPFDNGLVVLGKPTLEECQAYWDTVLVPTKRSIMFLIGDFICWIEDHYGDDWANLIDPLDIDISNVHKAKRVCRKFPITERHVPPLGFTHYDAVAKLPKETADALLMRAVRDNWGRETMREVVKGLTEALDKIPEPIPERPPILIPFERLAEATLDELADLISGQPLFIKDGRDVVAVLMSHDDYERMK